MEALKPVLKKNKIPVPSWKEHYYNRKLDKIQAEIKDEANEQVRNPEKVKDTTEGKTEITDRYPGRNKELEARNRRNNLILAGSIILAGFAAIFIYTRLKKQKSR